MKKIIEILSEISGINQNKIHKDTFIHHDLHMDRHDIIQAITGLEDEYDIIIDYKNIEGFHTVADLSSCVHNILA